MEVLSGSVEWKYSVRLGGNMGQRGRATAFDKDGKEIRSFKGNSGNGLHQQNFIDAVRSRDHASLNSDVEVGHLSTGWCNLANIAFRCGKPFTKADAAAVTGDHGIWQQLVADMEAHLQAHSVKLESNDILLSPMLTMDVETEQFVGENSDAANAFLKREYRADYVVPEIEV